MTDDENTPDDNTELNFKVRTWHGIYYCNSVDWNQDNDRVLYGAFSASDPFETDPDCYPVNIVVDGAMDIIPLRDKAKARMHLAYLDKPQKES